jgi:hypothetical protein
MYEYLPRTIPQLIAGRRPAVSATAEVPMFAWELVPTGHGYGQWLAAATAMGPIAVAAPRVPLAADIADDRDCWRWARWDSVDPGWEAIDMRSPQEFQTIDLADVVALVDLAWHPWLEEVTLTLLERLYAFRDVPLGGQELPDRARQQRAGRAYTDLLAEAQRAFPHRQAWPHCARRRRVTGWRREVGQRAVQLCALTLCVTFALGAALVAANVQ